MNSSSGGLTRNMPYCVWLPRLGLFREATAVISSRAKGNFAEKSGRRHPSRAAATTYGTNLSTELREKAAGSPRRFQHPCLSRKYHKLETNNTKTRLLPIPLGGRYRLCSVLAGKRVLRSTFGLSMATGYREPWHNVIANHTLSASLSESPSPLFSFPSPGLPYLERLFYALGQAVHDLRVPPFSHKTQVTKDPQVTIMTSSEGTGR